MEMICGVCTPPEWLLARDSIAKVFWSDFKRHIDLRTVTSCFSIAENAVWTLPTYSFEIRRFRRNW
jgi:hypothetical protein